MWARRNTLEFLPLLIRDLVIVFMQNGLNAQTCVYSLSLGWFFQVFSSLICKTHVHLWLIHVNVWQNQYSIVKQNKVKIKILKKKKQGLHFSSKCFVFQMKTVAMLPTF